MIDRSLSLHCFWSSFKASFHGDKTLFPRTLTNMTQTSCRSSSSSGSSGRTRGEAAGERREVEGGQRQGEETSERGCGGAHHSQTRSCIPGGWNTPPVPLLLPPPAQAVCPHRVMTSSSKNEGKRKKKTGRKKNTQKEDVEDAGDLRLPCFLLFLEGNLHRFQG